MNFAEDIAGVLKDRTCIVGVGNYIRRDDAVGLYLVDALKESVDSDAVHNAEDIIESYAFQIAGSDADNVLVVDAVRSGSDTGSVLFGPMDEYDALLNDCSTHKLSVKLASKIWKESGKKTFLLGIEAQDVDFGEGLTEPVRRSADMLKELFISTINSTRKGYMYEQ